MRLKTINTLLLITIILVNGYVITAPLLPAVLYKVSQHNGKQQQYTTIVHQAKQQTATVNQPNHIVIPSMLLNQPIYDGPENQQYKILDKGIWRFSYGSTPDKGGNTVLIGHRFTYTNPRGVFYYLNKVSMGDEMAVWWNNKTYTYKVSSITVVDPHDTAIEKPSKTAELTLFTCTPLWLPKQRLVIVATLEGQV